MSLSEGVLGLMNGKILRLGEIFAELYASEIGFEDFSGMMKCNYGANFLKAVLERWIEGLSYRFVASGSANG